MEVKFKSDMKIFLLILNFVKKKKNASAYIYPLAEDDKNLFPIMHIYDNYVHSFFFSFLFAHKPIVICSKNAVFIKHSI